MSSQANIFLAAEQHVGDAAEGECTPELLTRELNRIVQGLESAKDSHGALRMKEATRVLNELTNFFDRITSRTGNAAQYLLGPHVVSNVAFLALHHIVRPALTRYCSFIAPRLPNITTNTTTTIPSQQAEALQEVMRSTTTRQLRYGIVRPFRVLLQTLHKGVPMRIIIKKAHGTHSALLNISGGEADYEEDEGEEEELYACMQEIHQGRSDANDDIAAAAAANNDKSETYCSSLSEAPLLWKNAASLSHLCNHLLEVMQNDLLVAVVGQEYALLMQDILRWDGYARLLSASFLSELIERLLALLERYEGTNKNNSSNESRNVDESTTRLATRRVDRTTATSMSHVNTSLFTNCAPTVEEATVYAALLAQLFRSPGLMLCFTVPLTSILQSTSPVKANSDTRARHSESSHTDNLRDGQEGQRPGTLQLIQGPTRNTTNNSNSSTGEVTELRRRVVRDRAALLLTRLTRLVKLHHRSHPNRALKLEAYLICALRRLQLQLQHDYYELVCEPCELLKPLCDFFTLPQTAREDRWRSEVVKWMTVQLCICFAAQLSWHLWHDTASTNRVQYKAKAWLTSLHACTASHNANTLQSNTQNTLMEGSSKEEECRTLRPAYGEPMPPSASLCRLLHEVMLPFTLHFIARPRPYFTLASRRELSHVPCVPLQAAFDFAAVVIYLANITVPAYKQYTTQSSAVTEGDGDKAIVSDSRKRERDDTNTTTDSKDVSSSSSKDVSRGEDTSVGSTSASTYKPHTHDSPAIRLMRAVRVAFFYTRLPQGNTTEATVAETNNNSNNQKHRDTTTTTAAAVRATLSDGALYLLHLLAHPCTALHFTHAECDGLILQCLLPLLETLGLGLASLLLAALRSLLPRCTTAVRAQLFSFLAQRYLPPPQSYAASLTTATTTTGNSVLEQAMALPFTTTSNGMNSAGSNEAWSGMSMVSNGAAMPKAYIYDLLATLLAHEVKVELLNNNTKGNALLIVTKPKEDRDIKGSSSTRDVVARINWSGHHVWVVARVWALVQAREACVAGAHNAERISTAEAEANIPQNTHGISNVPQDTSEQRLLPLLESPYSALTQTLSPALAQAMLRWRVCVEAAVHLLQNYQKEQNTSNSGVEKVNNCDTSSSFLTRWARETNTSAADSLRMTQGWRFIVNTLLHACCFYGSGGDNNTRQTTPLGAAAQTVSNTTTTAMITITQPQAQSSLSSVPPTITADMKDTNNLPFVSLESFTADEMADGADQVHYMAKCASQIRSFLSDAESFVHSVYLTHLMQCDVRQEWQEWYSISTSVTHASLYIARRGSRAECERRSREVKQYLHTMCHSSITSEGRHNNDSSSCTQDALVPAYVAYTVQPYWMLLTQDTPYNPRQGAQLRDCHANKEFTVPCAQTKIRLVNRKEVWYLLSTEWLRWLSETLVQSLALLQRRLQLIECETRHTIRSKATPLQVTDVRETGDVENENEDNEDMEGEDTTSRSAPAKNAVTRHTKTNINTVCVDKATRMARRNVIALQAVQLLWLLLRLHRAGLWSTRKENKGQTSLLSNEALRCLIHSSSSYSSDANDVNDPRDALQGNTPVQEDMATVLSSLRPEAQLAGVTLWLINYITTHVNTYTDTANSQAHAHSTNKVHSAIGTTVLFTALRDMMADVGPTFLQSSELHELCKVPALSSNTTSISNAVNEEQTENASYNVLDVLMQCVMKEAMSELRSMSATHEDSKKANTTHVSTTSSTYNTSRQTRTAAAVSSTIQTPSRLPYGSLRLQLSLVDILLRQYDCTQTGSSSYETFVNNVRGSLVHALQADQLLPADAVLHTTTEKLVVQQSSSSSSVELIDWAGLDTQRLLQPQPSLPRTLPLIVPITHLLLLCCATLHTSEDNGEKEEEADGSTGRNSSDMYIRASVLWLLRVLFMRYRTHMLEDILKLLAAYFTTIRQNITIHATTGVCTSDVLQNNTANNNVCVDDEGAALLSFITDALLDRSRTDMPVFTPTIQAAILHVWFVALPHCRNALAEKLGRLSLVYLSRPVCLRLRVRAAKLVPQLFSRFARRADRVLQDLLRVLRSGVQDTSEEVIGEVDGTASTRTSTHSLNNTTTITITVSSVQLREDELVCATSLLALSEAVVHTRITTFSEGQREAVYALLRWAAESTRVSYQDLILQCLQRLSYEDAKEESSKGVLSVDITSAVSAEQISKATSKMLLREQACAVQRSLQRIPLYAQLGRRHGRYVLQRWLWEERRELAAFPCWCLGFCNTQELALHYISFLYPLALTLGIAASTNNNDSNERHGLVCGRGGELQRLLLYAFRETHCEDMAALATTQSPSNNNNTSESNAREEDVCETNTISGTSLEQTARLLTVAHFASCVAQLMTWAQEQDSNTMRRSQTSQASRDSLLAARRSQTTRNSTTTTSMLNAQGSQDNTTALARAARAALAWLSQAITSDMHTTTNSGQSSLLRLLEHVYGETTVQVWQRELREATADILNKSNADPLLKCTDNTRQTQLNASRYFACLLRVFADDTACILADLSLDTTVKQVTTSACDTLQSALTQLAHYTRREESSSTTDINDSDYALQAWLAEDEGDHVYTLLQHIYRRVSTHSCPVCCENALTSTLENSSAVVCPHAEEHRRIWLQLLQSLCLEWVSSSPSLLLLLPHVFRTIVSLCLHLLHRFSQEEEESNAIGEGLDMDADSANEKTEHLTGESFTCQAVVCNVLELVWLTALNTRQLGDHVNKNNTQGVICAGLESEVATTLLLLSPHSHTVRSTWQRLSARDVRLRMRDWRLLALPFLQSHKGQNTCVTSEKALDEQDEEERKDEVEVVDVDDMTEAERTVTQQEEEEGKHSGEDNNLSNNKEESTIPPRVQRLQSLLQLLQVTLEQDRWRVGLHSTREEGYIHKTITIQQSDCESTTQSLHKGIKDDVQLDCAEVVGRVVDAERGTLAHCIRVGCRSYNEELKKSKEKASEVEAEVHTCHSTSISAVINDMSVDGDCAACARLMRSIFARCTLLAIRCHRACIGPDTDTSTSTNRSVGLSPGLQLLRSLTWCFIEAGQLTYLETLVQLARATVDPLHTQCTEFTNANECNVTSHNTSGLLVDTSYLELLHVQAMRDRHAYNLHTHTSNNNDDDDDDDRGFASDRNNEERDEERTAAEMMNTVLGMTCMTLLRRLLREAFGSDSTRAALASAALRHWLSDTTSDITGRSSEDDAAVFTAMRMTLPSNIERQTSNDVVGNEEPRISATKARLTRVNEKVSSTQSACEMARDELLSALSSNTSCTAVTLAVLTPFQRLQHYGSACDTKTLQYLHTRIEDLPHLDDDSTLWASLLQTSSLNNNPSRRFTARLVLALLRGYGLAHRFTLFQALIPLLCYEADIHNNNNIFISHNVCSSSSDDVCEGQESLGEYLLPLICSLAMLEVRLSGREGNKSNHSTRSPAAASPSYALYESPSVSTETNESVAQRALRQQWSNKLVQCVLLHAAEFPLLTRRLLQSLRLCQALRMRVLRQVGLKPRPPNYYNTTYSNDAYGSSSSSARSVFGSRDDSVAYHTFTSSTMQAWVAHLTSSLVGRVPWMSSIVECYWLSDIPAAILARAALAIRAPHLAVAFVELSGESVLSPRGGIAAAGPGSSFGLPTSSSSLLLVSSGYSAEASSSAFGENTSVSVLFPWATGPQVQALMAADNAARQRTTNTNISTSNSNSNSVVLRASRSRTRAVAARTRWLSFYRVVLNVYRRVQVLTSGELFGEEGLERTHTQQREGEETNETDVLADFVNNEGDDDDSTSGVMNEASAMTAVVEKQLRRLEQLAGRYSAHGTTWALVQRARVLLRRGLLRSATELLLGGLLLLKRTSENKTQIHMPSQQEETPETSDKGVYTTIAISEDVRALCRATMAESAWRCGQWWPTSCISDCTKETTQTNFYIMRSEQEESNAGAELREVVRRWLRGVGSEYASLATTNASQLNNAHERGLSTLGVQGMFDTHTTNITAETHSFHAGLLEAMTIIHDSARARRDVSPLSEENTTQVNYGVDDDEVTLRAWRQLTRHVANAQRGLCAASLHTSNWTSAMFALEALSEVQECGRHLLLRRDRDNDNNGSIFTTRTTSDALPHWLREYGIDCEGINHENRTGVQSQGTTTTLHNNNVLRGMSAHRIQSAAVPYSAWCLLDTVRYGLCQLYNCDEWTRAVLQGCAHRALCAHSPHLAQRWLNDYLAHLAHISIINTTTTTTTSNSNGDVCTPALETRVELTLLRAQALYDLGSTRLALGLLQRAPDTASTTTITSMMNSSRKEQTGENITQTISTRWWDVGLPAEACTQPRVVHRLLSWCEALQCAPLAQLVRDPLLSHCVVKDQSGSCSLLLARLCHTLAREIAAKLKSHAFRQLRRSIVASRRVKAELERQLQAAMNTSNSEGVEAHVPGGSHAARVLLSSSQCKLLRHRLRSLGLDVDREEAELRLELENYALYRRSALNAYARYLQLASDDDTGGGDVVQAVFGFHELWLQAEDEEMVWSNDITEADMNNNNNEEEEKDEEEGRHVRGQQQGARTSSRTSNQQHRPLDRSVTEKVLRKALHYTPTVRFLPLFAQLAAQLAGGRDEERVEQLVRRIAQAHPLQTMWPLLALAHGRYFGPHNASETEQREEIGEGDVRRSRRRGVLRSERNASREQDNEKDDDGEDKEQQEEADVRQRRSGPSRRMLHRVDERKVAVAQGILRDLTMALPPLSVNHGAELPASAAAQDTTIDSTIVLSAAQVTAQLVHDASRLSAAYLELAAAKIPSRGGNNNNNNNNMAAAVYERGVVRPAISAANAQGEYVIAPGLRILAEIRHLCIPPPTLTLPVWCDYLASHNDEGHTSNTTRRGTTRNIKSANSGVCSVLPESIPTIHRFRATFTAPGGINHPKLLQCELSDGTLVRQLLKSNDDLRQDSLIEQVFRLANTLFARASYSHRSTQNTHHHRGVGYNTSFKALSNHSNPALRVYTYNVVPLAPTTGLVQWVHHTISYGEYIGGRLRGVGEGGNIHPRQSRGVTPVNNNNSLTHQHIPGAHERYFPAEPTTFECREALAAAPKSQKVATLLNIYHEFSPALHYFFLEHFDSAEACYVHQQAYIRSVAAASIVGYIVGLGDRHGSNLLLHERRAELIHIDLGIAFDQNKFLPIPELVPFRLTRNVVDGFGVRGTEGGFRDACAAALHTLRTHRDLLLTILRAFVHDPLANWVVQPIPDYNNEGNGSEEETNDEEEEEEGDKRLLRTTRLVKSEPFTANRTSKKRSTKTGQQQQGNSSSSAADAERALARVEVKLSGQDSGEQLTVETQVHKLIQAAQSVDHLAHIYVGWSPWL